MAPFEAYLEEANRAQTTQELFDVLVRHMSQYGYDKILFGVLTDHRDINLKAGIGVVQNYPGDWMKFYFEQGYDRIDPIVTYGVHQTGAFEWQQISKQVRLRPKQVKCLNLGREAGLHNGVSIPLRGPNCQLAGISLASSERKDACRFHADLFTAYCTHFYAAYKRLHEPQPLNPHNIVLTPSEMEVLRWAAAGKTDDEIAQILNVTRHTPSMHFRHICDKLGVNRRVMAIVKAITIGLIQPKDIT
jgi:LuxR family transcriptional regulator, quorum-sensing system regulator BjaR1